jgi:hypothetical protein
MTFQRAVGQRPLSTTDIAVYVGGLAVGLALTHVVIGAVSDGHITTSGRLALAGVGVFMAVFMYVRRAAMTQRRYAYYFLHVIAFVMVNASFMLHAVLMYSSGRGDEIMGSWQGVAFAMPLFWAVGLFLHTLGAMLSKGYEHVDV